MSLFKYPRTTVQIYTSSLLTLSSLIRVMTPLLSQPLATIAAFLPAQAGRYLARLKLQKEFQMIRSVSSGLVIKTGFTLYGRVPWPKAITTSAFPSLEEMKQSHHNPLEICTVANRYLRCFQFASRRLGDDYENPS